MTRHDTADGPGANGSPGMLDALLSPVRLPRRVVAEIETIGNAVRSLADIAERRLASIDDSAGTLVEEIAATLLPEPGDGPLARLKDTLSKS